jgi:hypothetical protein
MGGELALSALRQEQKLPAFWNTELRKMFGPKMDEVTRCSRKPRNENQPLLG